MKNVTILWDPLHEAVCYDMIEANIIAILTPDQGRYYGFQKHAKTYYMPCPSFHQIRLIGQLYSSCNQYKDEDYSDTQICKSMNKYGPSIGLCLAWSDSYKNGFVKQRDCDIARFDENELQKLVDYSMTNCSKDTLSQLWEHVSIFATDRNHPRCYRTPSLIYKIGSPEFLQSIQRRLQRKRDRDKCSIYNFLITSW
jgi:hypothetical protein